MDQIEQIKQRVDIVSLVGTYVSLKKSGKNYKGVCPFHNEKSPSFMVSPELQIFKCFGCNAAGDIFEFLQRIEGIEFVEALEQLAERAGITLEKRQIDPDSRLKKEIYALNEAAAGVYHKLLTTMPGGKKGVDYLTNVRKLTQETIREFKIGYAPDGPEFLINLMRKKNVSDALLEKSGLAIKRGGKLIDKFRNRVVFPFISPEGKFVGFTGRMVGDGEPKYLNTGDSPVFHKSFFIFGLNKNKVTVKKDGALLVEGQLDVISGYQAGIKNVLAISGTSLTEGQLHLLKRYTNNIIFCYDSDNAGVTATYRAIGMAEKLDFNIKVVQLPQDCKDLDDVVSKYPDTATGMVSKAVPAYDYILYNTLKRYNKNSPNGKKQIMDELKPWFSTISSKVLSDHYCKEISRELNLNEETVVAVLKKGASLPSSPEGKSIDNGKKSSQSPESYIISLLLKGDLDAMRTMGYKISPEDFLEEQQRDLFVAINNYISGDIDKFDPKKLKQSLSDEQRYLFDRLYLADIGDLMSADMTQLLQEFSEVAKRLNDGRIKARLSVIARQIEIAERSGSTTEVEQLVAQAENLKKQLLRQ